MKTCEVIVVGAGIAGYAVALALAKKGIPVTMMALSFDQRIYHSHFIKNDQLENKIQSLQAGNQEQLVCPRAYEQLAQFARSSFDELVDMNHLIDRNGNIDIYRALQQQLQQQPCVEWITNHSLIDLLTVERHSRKKVDCYKKPMCIGIATYNHDSQQTEYFLAKETILATGGASSIFTYSTDLPTAYGGGLAIANLAGARVLNMEHIHFHPLGLLEKDRPCFPLPLELLAAGGKLYGAKNEFLLAELLPKDLTKTIYSQLLKTDDAHLWLDLTALDSLALKEQFPAVDAYCLNRGINIAKDLLPIVPTACYSCGGIAVDKVGQTNIQRLRAIGSVSATGVFFNYKEEALGVLESLTWAKSCADDINKQISKLVYYFPDLTLTDFSFEPEQAELIEEDWQMLRHIMWAYAGIYRDSARLRRGKCLLEQLRNANNHATSLKQRQLLLALHTAQLVIDAALKKPEF